jgi:uncharacterized membrane protein YozB (DUF420 family)
MSIEEVVPHLPALNASLNAASAVLVVAGYAEIRSGRRALHGVLMASAFAVSTAFLTSYLTYHYFAGHRPYTGEGILRPIYYTILWSHVALAAAVVPLVLRTVYLAARRRWEKHRWWGRLTLPLWLYVSVTGVVVYFMLYRVS